MGRQGTAFVFRMSLDSQVKRVHGFWQFDDFDQILNRIKSTVHPCDVVVIMGAGKSYQLSQQILKSLTHDH